MSVTRKTRKLILERDEHRCVRCGKPYRPGWDSLQHRRARGMGGTKDPVADSPVNLVTLCGTATTPDGCHYWAEKRTEEAREDGYWLPHSDNPDDHPAQVPVAHWLHGYVYLLSDGTYAPVPHVETDFDRHADEAMAVANDPPDPRAGERKPRGSGAADVPEPQPSGEGGRGSGTQAWRKALAEHNKRKRNQRGRRSADPYRRYGGVRKPPDQEAT